MKKIILPILLILTGLISYVAGYVYIHNNNDNRIIKKRDYVMNSESTIPSAKKYSEQSEEMYILYPMYGEVWIYKSDGTFYDYTGIMLCNLPREEQIMILNRSRIFTMDELYSFLESYTS